MKSERKIAAHLPGQQRVLKATGRQRQHAPRVWAFAPIAAAVFLSIQAMDAASQPAGGQVKAGQASIQQNASNTQIRQTSQNAIIDWRNFNVAKDHSVIFNVPQSSNATLNRVTSNSPSTIYGSVQSNGRVFLINQAGVLIGPSGVIQTAGFTASTRDVDNASFMNGQALHFRGQSNGEVVNLGTIRSANGDVMLMGSRVVNSGSIFTPQGQTVLAAGDSVFVATSPFSQVVVEGVAAQGGVTNSGLIEAAQAKLLAAGSTYAMAVRNTGTIEAMGNELVRALVKVDAPGVVLSGVISAQNNGPIGEQQTGGQIHVSGQRIALQNAQITANGSQGGGQVLIGGAWQGANPEVFAHAQNVSMDQGSRISANATKLGAGGEVVLWSQGKTDFSGRIEANAGPGGGNGGRIEVSGRQVIFEGITSTQAPKGKRGVTLIDPDDVCIANDQTACAATDTYFNSSTLMFNLDLGDVTVNNNAALTTGNGDIKIKSYIFDNADPNANQGKLSLIAARDIIGAEAGMTMLYDLDMNAGRDVILTGITRSSRGRIDISAGRDFKLGMPFEQSSLGTGVGVGDSTLQTLKVQAGNNILIGVGAADNGLNNISGAGAVTLQAGNSLTLQTKPDTTQVPIRANTAGAASSTALTIKTGKFTNQ